MISVILCTHNPRPDYLERTAKALEAQTLDRGEWELIVIDNGSDVDLDQRMDVSWHPSARIVRENELGLTPARLRGIRESTGETLVFVDDDNVLAHDFLAEVVRITASHPFLGAWSGGIQGEFESDPPPWAKRYFGLLAIREVERDAWSNIYWEANTTPVGAGLCVRRHVALEYLRLNDDGLRRFRMDRAGQSLVSGGDNDLAACAIDLGLSCGVISSLKLRHLIPSERLSEDYLLRLVEGVAYSSIILRSFRPQTRDTARSRSIAGKAVDVVRKVRMTRRERRIHNAAARGEERARKELSQV